MKIVNMKMAPPESEVAVAPSKDNGPRYPWGLSLTLDEETIARLGLKSLPKVGTRIEVEG